jgi:hypothetical protein
MVMLYFAFVPPNTIERGIDRLCGYTNDGAPASAGVTAPWVHTLRLAALGLTVTCVLALGLARVFVSSDALDARWPDLRLLQPGFEAAMGQRVESKHRHKAREMQRWSPK